MLLVARVGQVFAVIKPDTKAMYACKTLNKRRILEKKRERLVVNERNVLVEVTGSPFITNLKYAFQDDLALYLLLDLMTGGEVTKWGNNIYGGEAWPRIACCFSVITSHSLTHSLTHTLFLSSPLLSLPPPSSSP